MISVAEAEKIILQHAFPVQPEAVALPRALGRILAEDLVADRDFPPFDRVTMDGIAMVHAAFEAGQRVFPIRGVQAAGMPVLALPSPSDCLEVMTGAMLPQGADAVIRYEDLHLENGIAQVNCETVNFRQNIHTQGSDRRSGDLLVPRGRKIGPAEIATAATIGKAQIRVARLPKTAIVSTGDELVEIADTPLPHQIRRSNVFSLQALLLDQYCLDSQVFHFPDDRAALTEGLERIFAEFELVVLSGAVSEGKFDFLPEVLESLGVEKCFHKVSQRPGKPFWFGHLPGRSVVFALPGNPVSTFLCACRYILPYLGQCCGLAARPATYAVLATEITFRPALTFFLPVRAQVTADGVLQAHALPWHGSGDLANLNDADGFLELPLDHTVFNAGAVFPYHRYRF